MSKRGKIVGCACFCILIAVTVIPSLWVQAASKDKVKVPEFVAELQKAAGTSEELLKEGEYNRDGLLTWKVAAVLTNRADVILNGDSYDKDLFAQVKEKKRLVGLSGLTSAEMKAARLCFVKGIIPGESMGSYSQARKFYPGQVLTKADMETLLERFKDKSKRIKLTPDGQVTRSNNLPKTYKYYDYILASFPNEFYETKLKFLRWKYGREQVRYQDYAYPKDMKKLSWVNPRGEKIVFKDDFAQYGDLWMEKVKTNLETRLNFDYRTVDNEWISKLRATYFVYGDADDKEKTDSIKKYVETAKKNKVIVKSAKVVVEPSSMYLSSGLYYVRCYVKFKVSADMLYDGDSMRQHELVYSSGKFQYFDNLKKDVWYEGYFDIEIDGVMGYSAEKCSVWNDNTFYLPKK